MRPGRDGWRWLSVIVGSFCLLTGSAQGQTPLEGLDLRDPMELAAKAIPPRLDPTMDYRPWFLLKGRDGIPSTPEHASWDFGDMTGRYLESLILARRMGITSPELSQAEERLGKYFLKILGSDGLVHDPQSGAVDHTFSQGSAMFGLLAWYEDSGDPVVRTAMEKLITAQLKRARLEKEMLVDPTVKLAESSGSHLAGYQIFPAIRFYELTGYTDALRLAEGLSKWALADPVLGAHGEITKPLSWEGHIHSWLETLAGCARTARVSSRLDRKATLARCREVYDWVRRSNSTSFGWVATYPTGGSSETCGIGSAIRLALELAAGGMPEYLNDVERYVRNQVLTAQFQNISNLGNETNRPSPLLLGCFDSQSMPDGHFGTRGGEDVGNVEGCCLNGGMRALAMAWDACQAEDERGVTIHLGLSRSGPAADVTGFQPFQGRVDVVPRVAGMVRIRIPDWTGRTNVTVLIDEKPVSWFDDRQYVLLKSVPAGATVSVRYPLREPLEGIIAGKQKYQVQWKGDVVVGVTKLGANASTPTGQSSPMFDRVAERPMVPDTYQLQDAARLASMSILGRMDLQRGGQPFFRIYPFADPPYASHEKWDDGDMAGRYVEGLMLARGLTGSPMDMRERRLRDYLLGLFDFADGLCYTHSTAWTERRACLFSQSSAMLGLLAWYEQTGSAEARKLLEWQADGLMRIAVQKGKGAHFPKYEWDGRHYMDDPPGKEAPLWYGGRLILPLVEYWQVSGREDVRVFVEELITYATEMSSFIKPDGAVEQGEGWWGHLHSTMDMAAGVAEFGRLSNRPELVAWAKRVYEWIGRTQTTRYGFVADVAGGRICEACGISSRIRLGLALYRAGATDPFGEIDRHLRNQLLQDQIVDLSFLAPCKPDKPRTDQKVYDGLEGMLRGTFQCWGTANDLIGNDDIEGCGSGGGLQGVALALGSQSEWRTTPEGEELRVNLLFNRLLRAKPEAPLTIAAPVAAELWSSLPYEGKVRVTAHRIIDRLTLRLPDGAHGPGARSKRSGQPEKPSRLEGQYVVVPKLNPGETVEVTFPLKGYETRERAAGVDYRVKWRGSSVMKLTPAGQRVPLYADREQIQNGVTPMTAPRYP